MSKTGLGIAKKMVNAKHDITMKIDNTPGPVFMDEFGRVSRTEQSKSNKIYGVTKTSMKEGNEIEKSDITVFAGAIEHGMKNGGRKSDGNGNAIELKSNTKEENIGATFVHEGTHSILGPNVKDPEKKPSQNGAKHHEEIKKQKRL